MAKTRADYSQSFRGLTRTDEDWLFLFGLGREEAALAWRETYRVRMDGEGDRRAAMDAVNPKYVLRNWVAETAIRAVEDRRFRSLGPHFEAGAEPLFRASRRTGPVRAAGPGICRSFGFLLLIKSRF